MIEPYKILEVTGYEGAIHLPLYLKYTVIVVDDVFPTRNMPHSTSLVFCETNVRYFQYKTEAAQTTISNKIMHHQVYKCIFYSNRVVLIRPQNIFRMFPHILGIENIAFFKG